jgi:Ca2+-binding RTX toxin-like protein
MKRFFSSKVKLISLITVVTVTFLFSFGQAGWAAVIQCPTATQTCNGTSGDDMIFGASNIESIIHGLGGNDYLISAGPTPDQLWGDEGNDTLLGSFFNDYMNGGAGNDKYDGYFGNDIIQEYVTNDGLYVPNNDVISGGEGNDWIDAARGSDIIHSGPGDDFIYPDDSYRDFSLDRVDCGEGAVDRIPSFHSGDGDTTVNCEFIANYDR